MPASIIESYSYEKKTKSLQIVSPVFPCSRLLFILRSIRFSNNAPLIAYSYPSYRHSFGNRRFRFSFCERKCEIASIEACCWREQNIYWLNYKQVNFENSSPECPTTRNWELDLSGFESQILWWGLILASIEIRKKILYYKLDRRVKIDKFLHF